MGSLYRNIKDSKIREETIAKVRQNLVHYAFYWVKFSEKEGWEVARWDKSRERFKFTNGSHCQFWQLEAIDLEEIEKRY